MELGVSSRSLMRAIWARTRTAVTGNAVWLNIRSSSAAHTLARTMNLKRVVAAVGRVPIVSSLIRQPKARVLLKSLPGAKLLYGSGWDAVHPFDRIHGTHTSGFVSADQLPGHEAARAHAVFYAGSQPSVLREGLKQLPQLETCTFVDLGCGKGRPLLVASEFPFRNIVGVELSPELAKVAERNAAIIAERFPARTPIRIAVGDASDFPIPSGDVVLFLYNPFDVKLIAKVVQRVEAALRTESRSIYIAYYNPVAAHCFDASSFLTRRFARQIPCAAEELGYGPDESDLVIIWQGGAAPPLGVANARLVTVAGGMRVILDDT
jgi:SAM-dependent methyltransferase